LIILKRTAFTNPLGTPAAFLQNTTWAIRFVFHPKGTDPGSIL